MLLLFRLFWPVCFVCLFCMAQESCTARCPRDAAYLPFMCPLCVHVCVCVCICCMIERARQSEVSLHTHTHRERHRHVHTCTYLRACACRCAPKRHFGSAALAVAVAVAASPLLLSLSSSLLGPSLSAHINGPTTVATFWSTLRWSKRESERDGHSEEINTEGESEREKEREGQTARERERVSLQNEQCRGGGSSDTQIERYDNGGLCVYATPTHIHAVAVGKRRRALINLRQT